MNRISPRPFAVAPLAASLLTTLLSNAAWAHDGHGLDASSHWHPTDTWGFVALVVAGAAWWFGGRK